MIPVTKPYLPQREKFDELINQVFERNWLTNNGPLVRSLEDKLSSYLNVNHLLYVNNGTIALQIAIKALNLKGEIITTPFSYVATTSSIVWEGCTAVFADIDSETLNIDPSKIEELITDKTSAILATHCFGNACDIQAIDTIAKRHNLKVIYDAAHCFGTEYKDSSIFNYGDISTCSLHATKLMHSVEGGFVVSKDKNLNKQIEYMRNFGHDGPEKFHGIGINGKNSEFHAAMGLCVLDEIDRILKNRKALSENYDFLLDGLNLRKPKIQEGCKFNFAYYAVLFENESIALRVKEALEENEIIPRRYFYPSLSKLSYVKKVDTPISDKYSACILCLPIYFDLTFEEQKRISGIIKKVVEDE
tara:strand:- start:426 stop:1508 length:1083 start_codon:yes stop_codon:yes gene_type:complete